MSSETLETIDKKLVKKDLTKNVILETFYEVENFENLKKVADNAAEVIKESIKSNDGLVNQSDVLIILSAYKNNKHNKNNEEHEGLQWIAQNKFKYDNVPLSTENLKDFGIIN